MGVLSPRYRPVPVVNGHLTTSKELLLDTPGPLAPVYDL